VSGREVFTLPPEGSDIWCLAWAPDGKKLAVGLSDGGVAVWDLEQVRARLAEFGFDAPSTATVGPLPVAAPIPEFDRVVRVNRLRADAERARRLAREARDAGDHPAERDHLLTALNLDERLAETVPDAPGHRKRLAWTHGALAGALARLGGTAGALRHLETEARILEQLRAEDPKNPVYRRLLAARWTDRSRVLDRAGRFAEAVNDAERARADREELAADPGSTLDREQRAVAYNNLAFQLSRADRPEEAERWYRAALAAQEQLATDSPDPAGAATFRANRGGTLNNLGLLRARAGDTIAAEKLLREAAAVRTRLADEFPSNPEYASDLGRTLEWLAGMLRDRSQFDESVRVFREAVQRQGAALELRPKNPVYRELWCKHQAQVADTLIRMGQASAAADAARELPRRAPDDPAVLLRAACLFVHCAALAQRNAGAPWGLGLALTRAYQREAVALVRRAIAKGLANAPRVLADPVFDPVRDSEEFRALLHEVNVPGR
jgi:tetratricopeptide (TPR) repeat protein